MALLSEKWIGICLGGRNRKGIGQVRSGKVFWFSPPTIGSIMADVTMHGALSWLLYSQG